MRKLFFIVLIVLLVFLIILFTSRDFRVLISSPFRTEIQNKINSFPRFKLKTPKTVTQKFDRIYDLYNGDYESKEYADFVTYLNENNHWEKAELIFDGETYKVKIKLHGKSPSLQILSYLN